MAEVLFGDFLRSSNSEGHERSDVIKCVLSWAGDWAGATLLGSRPRLRCIAATHSHGEQSGRHAGHANF
jgi:hypothetical protein